LLQQPIKTAATAKAGFMVICWQKRENAGSLFSVRFYQTTPETPGRKHRRPRNNTSGTVTLTSGTTMAEN
jgi:hypothetical protein